MKSIYLWLFVFSGYLYAGEFLEFGDKQFASQKSHQSNWTVNTGMQYFQFPQSLPEFNGQHDRTRKGDLSDVYGIQLGIGREFYLGAGFSTSILVGGSYARSITREIGKAAQDIDLDVANVRMDTAVSTYDISLGFNYLIETKGVDYQPFVEISSGIGSARVEKEYTRKALPTEVNGSEDYDVSSEEEFLHNGLSVGLNFISYKGIVSYLKLSSINLVKTQRETKGTGKLYGSATELNFNAIEEGLSESAQVNTVALGMRYLF